MRAGALGASGETIRRVDAQAGVSPAQRFVESAKSSERA